MPGTAAERRLVRNTRRKTTCRRARRFADPLQYVENQFACDESAVPAEDQ